MGTFLISWEMGTGSGAFARAGFPLKFFRGPQGDRASEKKWGHSPFPNKRGRTWKVRPLLSAPRGNGECPHFFSGVRSSSLRAFQHVKGRTCRGFNAARGRSSSPISLRATEEFQREASPSEDIAAPFPSTRESGRARSAAVVAGSRLRCLRSPHRDRRG